MFYVEDERWTRSTKLEVVANFDGVAVTAADHDRAPIEVSLSVSDARRLAYVLLGEAEGIVGRRTVYADE